jgi:hypothetical protein
LLQARGRQSAGRAGRKPESDVPGSQPLTGSV